MSVNENILDGVVGLTDEEKKALSVILPNVYYGAHWCIMEKDQDFINEGLIELNDGYLVELDRGIILNTLIRLADKLPKKTIQFYSGEYEKSLKKCMSYMKTFNGGTVAICDVSGCNTVMYEGELVPCFGVDFQSFAKICRKYKFDLVVGGRKIPVETVLTKEGQDLFLKSCKLTGNGCGFGVEVAK